MLGNAPIYANIPVTDLEKSKDFYVNTLGLKLEDESVPTVVLLLAGENTRLMLYQRPPVNADHTFASFTVENLLESITELKAKGINFENYDFGNGIKTDENGIMAMGKAKSAWFKDPDGHVLGINEKIN
jgi:catechol 2,3-dioxygenase-like lactoylglutathione lyase family enzyme